MSSSQVFHAVFNNKRWRIASIRGRIGNQWGWLVNIANPADQCRLSLASPHYVRDFRTQPGIAA